MAMLGQRWFQLDVCKDVVIVEHDLQVVVYGKAADQSFVEEASVPTHDFNFGIVVDLFVRETDGVVPLVRLKVEMAKVEPGRGVRVLRMATGSKSGDSELAKLGYLFLGLGSGIPRRATR